MIKIELEGKKIEVNNFEEKTIRQDDEETIVYSFECAARDNQEREKLRELLRLKQAGLKLEGRNPIQVMTKSWSESNWPAPWHFKIELTPYRKTYGVEDFAVLPVVNLMKSLEGLIKILADKKVLTEEDLERAINALFADEKKRDKIMEVYYGSDLAKFIKSRKKPEPKE